MLPIPIVTGTWDNVYGVIIRRVEGRILPIPMVTCGVIYSPFGPVIETKFLYFSIGHKTPNLVSLFLGAAGIWHFTLYVKFLREKWGSVIFVYFH